MYNTDGNIRSMTKKHSRRKTRRAPRQSAQTTPPKYNQQPIRKHKVRVAITNAQGVLDTLTVAQVAQLCPGIIAMTATTSSMICSQFRLNKVEAWATTAAVGQRADIALKWTDSPLATSIGISNPPVSVEDSTVSIDKPAHVVLKPPRNSFASNWFATNATANLLAFTLNANAGVPDVVMDFHYSFVLEDIGAPLAGPTIAGATAGVQYHKIVTGTSGLVYTPTPPLNAI